MNITINGKECGLHFGIRSIRTFGEAPAETGAGSEVDQVAQMVYAGIENYYYMKDRRPGTMPVTFEEIYLEIEEMALRNDTQKINELTQAFMNSQTLKVINEKATEEKKSQSTGKRSKQKRTAK